MTHEANPFSGLPLRRLRAIERTLWRKLTQGQGYQPFGYDWRTLKITSPHLARMLMFLQDVSPDFAALDYYTLYAQHRVIGPKRRAS